MPFVSSQEYASGSEAASTKDHNALCVSLWRKAHVARTWSRKSWGLLWLSLGRLKFTPCHPRSAHGLVIFEGAQVDRVASSIE